MSEEQEREERWKAIKGLLARLKRWWDILPTSFQIFYGFCIILGAATFVWFTIGPEYAKFVTYVFGGFLVLFQIMASARRATAAENTAKAMQKTAQSTEKGNIDERFKNAIEHLGHESASVRLGGIYALHHIAQEVEEYRERVFEILCAHIRETTTQEAYEPRIVGSGFKEPAIEIQSILDLLFIKAPGRKIYEGLEASLEGANLQEADLSEAILQDANLQGTDLHGANLQEVDLQGADLQDANLQDADLREADLGDANLQDANLQDADLREADLGDAENLEVEQLLKTGALHKAKLSYKMVEAIKQQKPELLQESHDEKNT